MTGFIQISMSIGMKYSKYFMAGLKDDNTVWGLGSSFFGQLGIKGMCILPTRIHSLDPSESKAISVAAGNLHTAVLKDDGTVWGMGLNISGQLGSLKKGPVFEPARIPDINNIISIDAAGDKTFAVSEDNILYILSDNGIIKAENAAAVYAGSNHCFMRKTDGSIWVTGNNEYGAFGNGTAESSKEFVPLKTLSDVKEISVGNTHTVVLTNNGRVLCSGDNSNGQLGIDSLEELSTSFKVTPLTDIVSISAGGSHTMALAADGRLFGFGLNFFGQLGDGTGIKRISPIQITGLPPVKRISAGTFNTMAITEDGGVYGWGSTDFGQLGDGTVSQVRTPFIVAGKKTVNNMENIKRVSAGLYNTAILTEGGELYTAGCNLYGQLGNGVVDTGRIHFEKVLDGVETAVSGGNHTVALCVDNTVWSWGNNANGQLGNGAVDVNENGKLGNGDRRNSPVPLKIDFEAGKLAGLSAGENHTLFLTESGDVYSVGLNNCGQLGLGGPVNTDCSRLNKIEALKDIIEIHAHKFRSAAVDKDGNLWSWGYNGNGELGDGTRNNGSVPKKILAGVSRVILGGWYTLAVKRDGTVWAYGMNMDGQYGNGTNISSLSPVDVTEYYMDIIDIAAGGFHTAVLKKDGAVFTCGKNEFGELGGGSPMSRNTFTMVEGLNDIKYIEAGWFSIFALKKDGTLYGFGRNNFGQIGGSHTNIYRPVLMKN